MQSKEEMRERMNDIVQNFSSKSVIEMAYMRRPPEAIMHLWFLVFTVLGEFKDKPHF